jgi:aminopeptidase N
MTTIAASAAPRLELTVDLDPPSRQLRATALVVPAEGGAFRFALHESLQVVAATVDGKAVPIAARERSGSVRGWQVQLPPPAKDVRIDYRGTLPALDTTLTDRAVLQRLPPMASMQGSFLPDSGVWYPRPAALFSYRVTVSVPAGQKAIVPGRLQSETATDASGRYRATFELAHPAEGIDLMAGPWTVREKLVAGANEATVRVRTYFPDDLDATPGLAEGYLDDTARYLRRYAEAIGRYAFSEFSIVASALPTGFGMPTLTYLGADVLRLPFIRATSLGHEVLHNWWGNGVYVDYASGNWSEGLTTFMADYAYREADSAEAAREMRQGWLRDFAAVPAGAHQALASFHSRTHGAAAAVGYGKAAMVFVMLRDLIGRDAFGRGIRALWGRYRFRAASWNDLRAEFEQASGRSLASFFAQWLERAEGPDVAIASARATSAKGRTRLTLTIEQGTPTYALHVPIEMAHGTGSEIRWVDVDAPHANVTLDVDAAPRTVRLDPELRVWRALPARDLPPILRRWTVARAPRLVQASSRADVREAAESLARRLCEAPARTVAVESIAASDEPVLLIGVHDDVDRVLAQAGLASRPAQVATRGTAQVWTLARADGAPLAVISAADAASLRALERPLPHYGGQSWLVFEGARVVERGTWPASVPVVPVIVETARN